MIKIIHPADVPEYDGKKYPMYCKISFLDGKLSITGVIGPRTDGNCAGSAGQIDGGFDHADKSQNDHRTTQPVKASALTFAPGWNAKTWHKFLDVWHRWHLNYMNAGCEHMDTWDTSRQLTLTKLGWGSEYHKYRTLAEDGQLSAKDYSIYAQKSQMVLAVTIESKPAHPDLWNDQIKSLISDGWIKIEKPETKGAGWVYPTEHPDGLLTKACPECGYKYGSAWKRREVPADVIAFLESLPDTDKQPAWV